jgi:hypothetical protein
MLEKGATQLLVNPTPPRVTANPIQFHTTRRWWTVDIGDAMRESLKYDQFVEGVVECVTRDRNVTMYGQSAHQSYINEEVRYPLISPMDLLDQAVRPRNVVMDGWLQGGLPEEFDPQPFQNWPNNYHTSKYIKHDKVQAGVL